MKKLFKTNCLIFLAFLVLTSFVHADDLDRGRELYKLGNYTEAVRVLESYAVSVKDNPAQAGNFAEANYLLARIYHEAGDDAKVDECLKKALQADRNIVRDEAVMELKRKVDKLRAEMIASGAISEQTTEDKAKLRSAPKTVKEGDLIPLNEVTVKPVKISGEAPAMNTSMRTKYRGQVMTILTLILVDEHGDVTKIRFLKSNLATDVQSLVEDTLYKWKYSPASYNGVKVKVWLTVAMKLIF